MTGNSKPPCPETLQRFAQIVGNDQVIWPGDDMRPYLVEWRDKYFGKSPLVVRPANTQDVSEIVKLANETQTSLVPQGGNTGLVGAQIPFETGHEVIVSFARMNKIRALHADNNTLIAEAGTILETIQNAASDADRFFPLSLGAEGSCQIGGNISTNAGGTGVLSYGNTRDLVLGLEVVLANGDIWGGLRTLRKDNTGYDLKQLFIGAEGTLGLITAAALKLFPKPRATEVAFLGVQSPKMAVDLFHFVSAREGRRITSFEIIPRIGLEFVFHHREGSRDPLSEPHPWYILLEASGGDTPDQYKPRIETLLQNALETGHADDAVLAMSGAQANDFWKLRTILSEIQKLEGGSIKHDVSVPVSKIAPFIEKAGEAVQKVIPGARPVPFGHLGDGNIHYNVSQPVGANRDEFLSRWEDMNDAVHTIVADFGGSISAEHGIGRLKRDSLPIYKSVTEMAMMRQLKRTFDPNNILNPGKLLQLEDKV